MYNRITTFSRIVPRGQIHFHPCHSRDRRREIYKFFLPVRLDLPTIRHFRDCALDLLLQMAYGPLPGRSDGGKLESLIQIARGK